MKLVIIVLQLVSCFYCSECVEAEVPKLSPVFTAHTPTDTGGQQQL